MREMVKTITYSDIAIEDIESGTYIGEYNVDFIYTKVAVTIEDGTITQIEILEHKNEGGRKRFNTTGKIN